MSNTTPVTGKAMRRILPETANQITKQKIYHFGSIYNNNSYHKVNEDINNLYIETVCEKKP